MHRHARHHDLAVVGDAHAGMWQRLADAATATRLRVVEAHDRRALAEPVAFEHRQPGRLGTLEQAHRHRRTAHRDEAQRRRHRPAALGGDDQHAQQFGHQHQALRRRAGDAGQHARDVRPGVTHAGDTRRRQQAGGAFEQRRVDAGDVLEQRRERQQAQVALDAERAGCLSQRPRHRFDLGRAETHALRLPGAARGIGDLGRTRRQRRTGRRVEPAAEHGEARTAGDSARLPAGQQFAQAPRVVADHAVDAGIVEGVRELGIGEETRQGHARQSARMQREIGDRPAGTVVGEQRKAFAVRCEPVALLLDPRCQLVTADHLPPVVEGRPTRGERQAGSLRAIDHE